MGLGASGIFLLLLLRGIRPDVTGKSGFTFCLGIYGLEVASPTGSGAGATSPSGGFEGGGGAERAMLGCL